MTRTTAGIVSMVMLFMKPTMVSIVSEMATMTELKTSTFPCGK